MAATNPLRTFRIEPQKILTNEIRNTVGRAAIQAIRDRCARQQDVSDSQAAAYSPRGPIYVPLTYAQVTQTTGFVRAVIQSGRTKTSLGGRYSMKRTAYLKHLQSLGYPIKLDGKLNRTYKFLKDGKFADWADFKRSLGRTGNRDLNVTGKMLGAITITEMAPDHVSIGFQDLQQEAKAKGNMRWSDWFGFSQKDQDVIFAKFEELMAKRMEALFK